MLPVSATLIAPDDQVISIVGAGGKTSLMFLLAQGFIRQGQRVITTTTTRIRVPSADQSPACLCQDMVDSPLAVGQALDRHGHVTVGSHLLAGDKLQGLTPQQLEKILSSSTPDRMIIEADGARSLSLKAPGANEPVVPAWTDLFIAMVSLDCIGRPLTEDFVFRPNPVAAITGLRPQDPITTQALARLAAHPQGMLKGCPPTARSCIFFNKAEDTNARKAARQIIAAANTLPGIRPDFWVYGSIKQNTCTVHPAA